MAPAPVLSTEDLATLQAALEKALREIGRAVDKIWDKFDDVVDRGAVLAALYGSIAAKYIHDALVEIRDQLDQLVDLAQEVSANGTPVVSLFIECFSWLSDVMQPASEIAARSDKPADDNLVHWTGGAAGAYRAKQAMQKTALDKMVENADQMSQWLGHIGQANVQYAATLLSRLAGVAAKLTEAAALSAMGHPAAVSTLADQVTELVKIGLDELKELANGIARMILEMRDLAALQMRHTEFENGDWPQAVFHVPGGPVASTADPVFRTS